MSHTEIAPDALAAAVENIPGDTPFLMLNLLKFREHAQYERGQTDGAVSGREAYARYGKLAQRYLTTIGAEVVVMGPAQSSLIGPADERWDVVMLVRYPSIDAFAALANDPEYAKIAVHRTAALADSRLIPVLA